MTDTKRMLAAETLKRFLADMPGHERKRIAHRMYEHFRQGGGIDVPVNVLRATFAQWHWTPVEWADMFRESGETRRRELRRSTLRRDNEIKDKKKKQKRDYMREYMRKRRAAKRKSVDDRDYR